jgi:DNA-binding transcriptional regulator YiaG
MKNTKSTTAKSNRTSNKATVKANRSGKKTTAKSNRSANVSPDKPYNYRHTRIGAIRYKSASGAARAMLKNTKLSQSEIARRCGVSQPCVAQLKAELAL